MPNITQTQSQTQSVFTDFVELDTDFSGSQVVVCGVDAGNEGTKAACLVPLKKGTGPTSWKLVLTRLRSSVTQGIPEMFQKDETAPPLVHVILDQGEDEIDFMVNVPTESAMSTGSRIYQLSFERGCLIYAALSQTLARYYTDDKNARPVPVSLAASMMAGQYYGNGITKLTDNIEKLRHALITPKFRLGPTTSGPNIAYTSAFQGISETLAIAAFTLINECGVRREFYPSGGDRIKPGQSVLICDVGWKDTTVMLIVVSSVGTPMIKGYHTTQEISISKLAVGLHDFVKAHIFKNYGNRADTRMVSGQQLLEMDTYRVFREDLGLQSIKAKLLRALDARLKAYISTQFGDATDVITTVLAGGVVELTRKVLGPDFYSDDGKSELRQLNNLYIPEHPEFANALGALATANLRANNK